MIHPIYAKYLQHDTWMEASREMMVALLRQIGFPFIRLTRLEDKRIWEVFYDLDDLGFQFDTPDELIETFKIKCHPSLFMACTGWKVDGCVPKANEVKIGLLVLAPDGTEDRSK